MTYYWRWNVGWSITADDGKRTFPANSLYLASVR